MAAADPARIRTLLLENLFAVVNVRDPARRLAAITRNYTEEVKWTDHDGTTQGHLAMNEKAQILLGGLGALAFNVGMPEETPAVSGFDVALVRDGRIAVLHTLLTAQS